jgi:hypothetical protein
VAQTTFEDDRILSRGVSGNESVLSDGITTAAKPADAKITTPAANPDDPPKCDVGGNYSLAWNKIGNATSTQTIARILDQAPVPNSTSEAGTDLTLTVFSETSRSFQIPNNSSHAGKWVKFFVQGQNGTGSSLQSGLQDVKYVQIKPATPAKPSVSQSNGTVTISWMSTDRTAAYRILRHTSSTGEFKPIKTVTSSYVYTTDTPGPGTYYYRVEAVAQTTS